MHAKIAKIIQIKMKVDHKKKEKLKDLQEKIVAIQKSHKNKK